MSFDASSSESNGKNAMEPDRIQSESTISESVGFTRLEPLCTSTPLSPLSPVYSTDTQSLTDDESMSTVETNTHIEHTHDIGVNTSRTTAPVASTSSDSSWETFEWSSDSSKPSIWSTYRPLIKVKSQQQNSTHNNFLKITSAKPQRWGTYRVLDSASSTSSSSSKSEGRGWGNFEPQRPNPQSQILPTHKPVGRFSPQSSSSASRSSNDSQSSNWFSESLDSIIPRSQPLTPTDNPVISKPANPTGSELTFAQRVDEYHQKYGGGVVEYEYVPSLNSLSLCRVKQPQSARDGRQ